MSNLLAPNQKTSLRGHITNIHIFRILITSLLLVLLILSTASPVQADTPPFVPDGTTNIIFLPIITTGSANGGEPYRPSRFVPKYNLEVDETGIYRVTYEDLLDAGLDLLNVKASDIAMTNQGRAIPIYVHSNRKFGPGSYIEFYGQAVDSIYTHTNIYTIFADRNFSNRVAEDDRTPDPDSGFESQYMHNIEVEHDRYYAFNAPGDDPWYDTNMLTYNTPKTWEFPIEINHYANNGDIAMLSISLWGAIEINNIKRWRLTGNY